MQSGKSELDKDQIEQWLIEWRNGNETAKQHLFSSLYGELAKISAAMLSHEDNLTLLTTGDLINETALKLLNLNRIQWQDQSHFLALSARVMRQVLIDHYREKNAKRRQHHKVQLVTNFAPDIDESIDYEKLETALQQLQQIKPESVEIVEMRYFGGLSFAQIADVTGVSESTVKRSWRASRAWLLDALDDQT
ncbi:ECF-type sigma factor [Glaciecola sp. 1036]|uniref:ECF-type sigma factor n=1 Tax=Alteromonadaceae TaxID=72275 RepID=UPI003D025B62